MSSKETMDVSSSSSGRRRGSAPKAGSVWESRMKIDQFKGGIKVFNEIPAQNEEPKTEIEIPNKQSPNPLNGVSGKRKTWKSESCDGSPVKIAALRSELSKEMGDGIRKSPVSIKKTSLRKAKSDCVDVDVDVDVHGDGDEKKVVVDDERERKSRSDCEEIKAIVCNGKDESDKKNEIGVNDDHNKQKRIVIEEKKLVQTNQKTAPISSFLRKQPSTAAANYARLNPNPSNSNTNSDNFQRIPRTSNNRLQSFVDLIMWRDVSKSAFVFGVGTFAIISSSYTKDLNISFISVLSYLGLLYLAAIFLFRSLINRGGAGEKDNANQDCVIGEEEAVWVIKLLLPSINEFLLKLRALFSGDPSTTMKLAMLLFILARCGSSITIFTTAKLGFIGVFTVPKVCSAYSSQITAHGTFWIRRMRETWASCSHKKAVGFAVFALVWNLSSVVTRIWAVFMLFVAFKHYQRSSMWAEDEEINGGDSSSCKDQKLGRRTTLHNNTTTNSNSNLNTGKLKKGC